MYLIDYNWLKKANGKISSGSVIYIGMDIIMVINYLYTVVIVDMNNLLMNYTNSFGRMMKFDFDSYSGI